jgi:protein TonB
MEQKKSPKADIEKRKGIFLSTGIVIALSVVLLAFEWTPTEKSEDMFAIEEGLAAEDEIIPITRQELIPPPPPPVQTTEVLQIVEDNKEIQDELEIEDSETDEKEEVAIVEVEEDQETDEVFQFAVIEDKPEFPGGMDQLLVYIAKNTKYPEIAKENGIAGKVYVQFVIGKDGKVSDVQIMRGRDPYLDKEALRVVKSLPDWKPGKQRGKAVKVSYVVPINFKLQ